MVEVICLRIAEYKDGNITYRDMSEEEIKAIEQERQAAEMLMPEPTHADRIEAQVMYTALMTDTLLMED